MIPNSELNIVTGDHVQEELEDIKNISVTNKQKIVMDTLPKTVQDMLNLNIRRFNGKNAKEADQWLKDITQWRSFSKLSLMAVFDILLSEEAQLLWLSVKESKTEDTAYTWFVDTFTIKKSFSGRIMELASLKQRNDERFATFELRTISLLREIMSSGMTEEELLLDLLKDKVRDRRLQDVLLTKPDIKIDEARGLAKIFEANSEVKNTQVEIYSVEPKTYANVAQGGQGGYSSTRYQPNQRQERRQEPFRRQEEQKFIRYEDRRQSAKNEEYNREEKHRRPVPTSSLKDIAKKLYDVNRGIQPQQPRRLSPGDCFCCGNRGHMRHECPLKGKCLLCGRDDHNFRECHLLSRTKKQNFRVACVQEDEENKGREDDNEDNVYYEAGMRSNNIDCHDLEGRKNANDPIGSISSVGSRE